MNLTEEQIDRYSRQIVLKEIGGSGQEKILNSKISLIGLGALGSPVAYYLVAAGIGKIKLIDYDSVERSDLHRQILHSTEDMNRKKTESAIEKLNRINPDCKIEIVSKLINSNNVKELIQDSDFVIEGSDNFPTKLLINDICCHLKIPFTVAKVLRFHGQILTVVPEKKTACYRCVFGDVANETERMSYSLVGIIGLIPGVLGCLEANEAIKYIIGKGDLSINKILYIDLLLNKFNTIDVYRNENCPACGEQAENLVGTYNYKIEDEC
ncbi:MAG: HesA/MoeB/ThiF family protein [Promethearchaeota archaeon]|jgi:adenylyltransferase/sulfurtransferase